MWYTCSNTVYLMENQKVKNVTAVSDLSKPAFVISMVRECATVLANIMRYLHCFMTTLLPSRNAFHLLDSDQLHYWGNKKSNSPGICCPMHGIYFCKMSPESTSGAHLYSAYRLAWCCGLSKRCVTCGFSCLLETQISIITNLKQYLSCANGIKENLLSCSVLHSTICPVPQDISLPAPDQLVNKCVHVNRFLIMKMQCMHVHDKQKCPPFPSLQKMPLCFLLYHLWAFFFFFF